MATSDGGRPKINQPPPASIWGNGKCSCRNFRSASASLLYRMVCAPVIGILSLPESNSIAVLSAKPAKKLRQFRLYPENREPGTRFPSAPIGPHPPPLHFRDKSVTGQPSRLLAGY